jgi:hypothetical protein
VTEIYQDESKFVYFDIVGAAASGLPTATLKRTGSADASLTVATSATIPAGVTERYEAYITLAQTSVPGEFTVVWQATVGGEPASVTQHYEVVVPYATPNQIAARLGWQFYDPSVPGYQNQERIQAAESICRNLINHYTGTNFSPVYKTVMAQGQDADVLSLSERVVSISKIYQNNELIYDATIDPAYNYFNLQFSIADSGYGIRISEPDWDVAEEQQITVIYEYGKFKQDWRYDVEGTYGYPSTPTPIFEAMIMLVNDLMCQDSIYRNKYINGVMVKDWKFSYNALAWVGTGNAIVDDLLSIYKTQPVWVI